MSGIKWVGNKMKDTGYIGSNLMSIEEIEKARAFHKSFPEYEQTPLTALNNLASELGLGGIYIKDESYRFGLNAFKVLGGSYAMAGFIAKKLGKNISELSYDMLISDEVKNNLGELIFYTATDGNHGRGVAWAAKGMRVFAAPLGNDKRIISGESGAVGLGFLMELMTKKPLKDLREKLQLSDQKF